MCEEDDQVPLLRVANLTGGYGLSQVLFGVSIEIAHNGVVAILGRNGAGKTTLLRTLLGYLPASGGTVQFCGEEITGEAPAKLIRRGIGYMPQEQAVFPGLSVEENLTLGARVRPKGQRASLDEAYARFPKLRDRRRQAAGTMSGGERKMLGLARVMLGRPDLYVVDEPTEGVWHGVVEEMMDVLRQLSTKSTIVLVEQHLDLALALADSVHVLQRGEVVMQGLPDDLRDDPQFLGYLSPTSADQMRS